MNKEFVPYQPSLDMKEIGFDEPCFGYHLDNKFQFFADVRSCNTNSEFGFYPTAPTFSQAFRWFREKHDLCGIVLPFGEGLFDYRIYSAKEGKHLFGSPEFKTYEEAKLYCLIKLIEIVKNK